MGGGSGHEGPVSKSLLPPAGFGITTVTNKTEPGTTCFALGHTSFSVPTPTSSEAAPRAS